MEIIRCPRGHYYDPGQTSGCPKCAQENAGVEVDFGATQPATSPIEDDMGDYGHTEPIIPGDQRGFDPVAGTVPNTGSMGTGATEPWDPDGMSGSGRPKVEGYDATTPVGYGGDKPVVGFKPVVGWLVCIDGNNKGSDYRIHNGYNYIGRAQSMDIVIPGDQHISNENAAIVAYDNLEHLFYFGPGMGHNAVRLNGKMCLGQSLLNAYDEITIGATKLLFIPLCGERFDWDGIK